jgi:hypothetical protein
MRIYPKVVTPERFYREFQSLVTVSSGFPIEAFGNDRFLESDNSFYAVSWGELPKYKKNGLHALQHKGRPRRTEALSSFFLLAQ